MHSPINEELARYMIDSQIPQWKHLKITPIAHGGWDNRTFHLGETMSIRMPSAEIYAHQIEKEFYWLPILAPLLPKQISIPLIIGKQTKNYSWSWGIYKWLEGETVTTTHNIDLNMLAKDLGTFLKALYTINSTGGPAAGSHNFYRGGHLHVYNDQVQQALVILENKIDTSKARMIWESAVTTTWEKDPVWVHGDIAAGNLLVQNGKLNAVIDFGGLAVGDPACDLAIAWTQFTDSSRQLFKESVSLDHETWNRGKAWALWKALIIAAKIIDGPTIEKKHCWQTLDAILRDTTSY